VKIRRVMENYGDTLKQAKENIRRSDEARAAYYRNISGQGWGERHNYDLLIDSSSDLGHCAETITEYVLKLQSGKQAVK
ncbi:MAG: cytidylate kinase-like family protein, partial [Ruminiclostridium sp.]|nr:cytidylate kinase-like family protein [Ruminiclostridium sp.]